jgi:hypothetical protein
MKKNVRGLLYMVARVLGDLSAARKGRIGRRVGRRAVGKWSSKVIGKFFK